MAVFFTKSHGQASIGTITAHASAELDITSENAGLLTPKMTTAQMNAIASPAKGLLVYDTDRQGFYGYDGTSWTNIVSVPRWLETGNSIAATNFIGTTDARAFNIRTNNTTKMSVLTNSQVNAIGPDFEGARVVVRRAFDNASHPTVYSEYSGGFGAGSPYPGYYVASNEANGSVRANYAFADTEADAMSGNSSAGFSYVNDPDGAAGLSFYTGGHPASINDRSLERLKITNSGNVGIGISNPKSRVEIQSGNLYISDPARGIVTRSASGQCWRITVNNDGTFSTTSITCP